MRKGRSLTFWRSKTGSIGIQLCLLSSACVGSILHNTARQSIVTRIAVSIIEWNHNLNEKVVFVREKQIHHPDDKWMRFVSSSIVKNLAEVSLLASTARVIRLNARTFNFILYSNRTFDDNRSLRLHANFNCYRAKKRCSKQQMPNAFILMSQVLKFVESAIHRFPDIGHYANKHSLF